MESHKRPNHNLKHICDICGAKYARRFALNDHMKEQHKDVQLVQIIDVKLFTRFSLSWKILILEKIFLLLQSGSTRKSQTKRAKKTKQIEIIDDDQELDAIAGESILPNIVEQEVITTISTWFKYPLEKLFFF